MSMMRRAIGAALLALAAATTAHAALECRQSNYVTRDGKIFAQDPEKAGTETEITIRGVTWSGMEKENMIPEGLFGATIVNNNNVEGTRVSKLLEFLSNNSFNSIRLPLNAQAVNQNAAPRIDYIHGWENRELTSWENTTNVRYLDLVGRVVETFQEKKISVLLDLHLLNTYPQDAYWYTAPYVDIEKSEAYQAVSTLAKTLCSAAHWNILGVDLKSQMSNVLWNANAADADKANDWRGAAEILANRVLDLCPSWLVFVGGASSPTDAQRFKASDKYKTLSNHWDGGNLRNATANPLKMNANRTQKIVFAPQAHTHGKVPQNYFFTPESNCTQKSPIEYFGFEYEQFYSECVDFVFGKKKESRFGCSTAEFGCSGYKHLGKSELKEQYTKVLDEAIGDLVKEGKTPVIFGSFSGVYGAATQPQQTVALDTIIDYAVKKLRGGYYFGLNPDTEYFLEDSTNPGSGLFGRTHYGVFNVRSWQEPNEDLLAALSKLPSSKIPCYGEKAKSGKSNDAPSAATASLLGLALTLLVATYSAL